MNVGGEREGLRGVCERRERSCGIADIKKSNNSNERRDGSETGRREDSKDCEGEDKGIR